jgi:hypothetical protein
MFKVPLRNGNGLERLKVTEKDCVEFHEKGLNQIPKRFLMPLMALLPAQVLEKSVDSGTPFCTSWAAIVAGSNYSLLGSPVTHIYPFVGLTNPKMSK